MIPILSDLTTSARPFYPKTERGTMQSSRPSPSPFSSYSPLLVGPLGKRRLRLIHSNDSHALTHGKDAYMSASIRTPRSMESELDDKLSRSGLGSHQALRRQQPAAHQPQQSNQSQPRPLHCQILPRFRQQHRRQNRLGSAALASWPLHAQLSA